MARSRKQWSGQGGSGGQQSGSTFPGGGNQFGFSIPPHVPIPQNMLTQFTMWVGNVPYVYKLQRQSGATQQGQTQQTQSQQGQSQTINTQQISPKQLRGLTTQITQQVLQELGGQTALPKQGYSRAKGSSYNQGQTTRNKQLVNV